MCLDVASVFSDEDHDIAHLVAGVGVAMGLGDVAKRVRAADNRAEAAGLDERLEELEVGLHWRGGSRHEDGPAAQVHPETA